MNILYVYKFPDGIKAYFLNGNRKQHILIRPYHSFDTTMPYDVLVVNEMKIGYENWRKRYAS